MAAASRRERPGRRGRLRPADPAEHLAEERESEPNLGRVHQVTFPVQRNDRLHLLPGERATERRLGEGSR